MILITGAAGKTGRALINALQRSGRQIRAFVRNQVQADLLISLGAEQTFIGDLRSSKDLERAVQGVRAVYHICPNMHPDEVAIGQSLISASRGKIEHFVYHSVFHPQIETMPHHWNKLRVEELIIGSGLDFTIFQPTAYMQNVLGQLDQVKRSSVYRIPYNVDTRVSMVDLGDVAEVAADSLASEGYFLVTKGNRRSAFIKPQARCGRGRDPNSGMAAAGGTNRLGGVSDQYPCQDV